MVVPAASSDSSNDANRNNISKKSSASNNVQTVEDIEEFEADWEKAPSASANRFVSENNGRIEDNSNLGFFLNSNLPKRKLLNKYSYDEVEIDNLALQSMIYVKQDKSHVTLPHTAGRYNRRSMGKLECPLVERLINSMMFQGRNSGKKLAAINRAMRAMELIHLSTAENPIQVLINACQNAAIREDKAKIGYSTMQKPSAVDVAPYRALNKSLYYLCQGAKKASRRSLKKFEELVAEEIMNCAKNSSNSYAIKKKDEVERTALASR